MLADASLPLSRPCCLSCPEVLQGRGVRPVAAGGQEEGAGDPQALDDSDELVQGGGI